MMDITEVQQKLATGAMSSRVLLSRTKVFDESVRSCSIYADNRHFPFYYYLGQQIKPEKVMQVGPYLGLPAACFLQGCRSVKEWLCVGERTRITESNIQLHCKGWVVMVDWDSSFFEPYKSDIAFLSQQFPKEDAMGHMEFLWDHLEPEGLLVVDYITVSSAFTDFCRVKNRDPIIFQTRHSVGIVQR